MFKNYPIIIQSGRNDCGLCCLSMILDYHGINISIDKLRLMTHTNQDGTSALNLINTSKRLGLKACGVAGDINKIEQFPVIAHLILENNYLHYVVIYKVDKYKNQVVIGDPAKGIVTTSISDFMSKSSKVFILFNKNKKMIKIKDLRFKEFLKNILLNNKLLIIKSFLVSLFVIFFSIIFSFYLRSILNVIDDNSKVLLIVFFSFLLIAIIKNILDYYKNKIVHNLSVNVDSKVTIDTYKHLFKLPYQYLMNKSDGEIFSIIGDLSDFKETITGVLLVGLIDITMLFSVFVFFSIINFSFFIYGFLLCLILILLSKYYNNKFNSLFVKLKRSSMVLTSYLLELLSSIDTIKNLNIYKSVTDNLNNKYLSYLDEVKDYNKIYNKFNINKSLINDLFLLLMILSSTIMVKNNQLLLYDLVLFESLYLIFNSSINNIIDNLVAYNNYIVGINRVLDIYDVKEEQLSNDNYCAYKNIEYRNLTFAYGNKKIFDNLNLKIDFGEKILLTGSSGSGKSTLAKILLAYIKKYHGKVLLDNSNINEINPYVIRENITYVSQNDKLFSDTIRNNITMGSRFPNNLDEVCKIVKIDEMLNKKGHNLDYFIEEQGSNLSGGEKKRILIARALLRNSNIIIFDESFNEIEQKLEYEILQDMFKSYHSKTVIVISHRLTSRDLFDRCLKIDNKKIGGNNEKNK